MSAGWTKGPLRVAEDTDYPFGGVWAVNGPDGKVLAHQVLNRDDAQLYAASPAMYEALVELRSMYAAVCDQFGFAIMSRTEVTKDLAKADAALSQARGEGNG